QKNVIDNLSDEFGENSREVADAKTQLSKFERGSKLAETQVKGLDTKIDNATNSVDKMGDEMDQTGRKSKTFGDRIRGIKDSMVFGAVAGTASRAVSGVIDKVKELGSEAMNVSDSMNKFQST